MITGLQRFIDYCEELGSVPGRNTEKIVLILATMGVWFYGVVRLVIL